MLRACLHSSNHSQNYSVSVGRRSSLPSSDCAPSIYILYLICLEQFDCINMSEPLWLLNQILKTQILMLSVFKKLFGKRLFSTSKQRYLKAIDKLPNNRLQLEILSFGVPSIPKSRLVMVQAIAKYVEGHPEVIDERLKLLNIGSEEFTMQKIEIIRPGNTTISDYSGHKLDDRSMQKNKILVEMQLGLARNIVTPVLKGLMLEDMSREMLITNVMNETEYNIKKSLKNLVKRSLVLNKMAIQPEINHMEIDQLRGFALRVFCLQKQYKNTVNTIDVSLPTKPSEIANFLRSATLMKAHMPYLLGDYSKDVLKLLALRLTQFGVNKDINSIIEHSNVFGFLDLQLYQENEADSKEILKKYFNLIIQALQELEPNSDSMVAGTAEAVFELIQTETCQREEPQLLGNILKSFESGLDLLCRHQSKFLASLGRQPLLECLLKSIYLLKDTKVSQNLSKVLLSRLFQHYLMESEGELILGLLDFCTINEVVLSKEELENIIWNQAVINTDVETIWKAFSLFKRTGALALYASLILEGELERQLQNKLPNKERIVTDRMYQEIRKTNDEWEKQYDQPDFFI